LLIIKRQSIGGWLKRQDRNRTGILVITVVFFGTFLGIFLQQLSLQRIPAGITQTLIATSPIFVLPISALLGEKISLRAVFGALLAIIGVALIFVPPL
jgi:drug/metabolite transporter (DMT)-like permease